MLTRRTLSEQPNPQKPSWPDFKKTNVVLIDGVKRIVTAKLQGDGNSNISYSTCTLEDLKDHQHGKPLRWAILVPDSELSPDEKRKASYFA